jgi:DNA primase
MDRAVAERFGLGFAPREAPLLRTHLAALGYDDAVQIQAGLLVVKTEGAEPRARFRNRLMFPIYDPQGRVIAFGGRIIGVGEPKYLNSAESPTFQKGSTLYGLNWAKQAIRRDERVLLVEGYFDCVRLLATGIECTVAPLGTALTDAQAELIRKYTSTAFLLYDSDKAGLRATFRNGDVLLRQGIKVHVVTLPEGEDPDTFVSTYGREKLETQLGAAIDVFERKLQILQRGSWFSDLRRKRVALDRLLPTIRAAADPITRGLYLARAAEVANVAQDVLERELRYPARAPGARSRGATPATERQTPDARVRRPGTDRRRQMAVAGHSAEKELVRLLVHRRQFVAEVSQKVSGKNFRDQDLAEIFTQLVGAPNDSMDAISANLSDEATSVLNDLLADQGGLDVPARIIADCLAALKRRAIDERIATLDRQIPLADGDEKDRLISRKQKLQERMRSLGGPQSWGKLLAPKTQ